MKHSYTSQYKNVSIFPLSKEYIELLRTWRNDKKNAKYLRNIPYITSEMQDKWYEDYIKNKDEICFVIYENQDLKRVVGSLSLYNFQGNQAEFGKILIGEADAHGRSVGYHAILAVMKIAFEVLELDTVVLHVFEENIAARHIYEKAGFIKMGSKSVNNMIENYMELHRSHFVGVNHEFESE